MASLKANVFLLGASGYIGGALLAVLKKSRKDFFITALIRSKQHADPILSAGADEILDISGKSSSEVLEAIRITCSNTDVVFNAADADDMELTQAIISGLKTRAESSSSSRKPILVHTSGTGVIMDKAEGSFSPEAQKVWNDNSEEDIMSIDKSQLHRLIDLEIFAADSTGLISAYIIAPSTVYGVSKNGPVRQISQQVPRLITTAIRRQQTVYVGEGTNRWNSVHIDDLTDLYLLVLSRAESESKLTVVTSSFSKFFFGSVDEYEWGNLARELAVRLHARGLVPNSKAISVPKKEEPRIASTNSRSVSERGFNLGWKPQRPTIFETLESDIDATLAEGA